MCASSRRASSAAIPGSDARCADTWITTLWPGWRKYAMSCTRARLNPAVTATQRVALERDLLLLAVLRQRDLDALLLAQALEPAGQAVVEHLLGLGAVQRVEPRRAHEQLGDPAREAFREAREARGDHALLGAHDRFAASARSASRTRDRGPRRRRAAARPGYGRTLAAAAVATIARTSMPHSFARPSTRPSCSPRIAGPARRARRCPRRRRSASRANRSARTRAPRRSAGSRCRRSRARC